MQVRRKKEAIWYGLYVPGISTSKNIILRDKRSATTHYQEKELWNSKHKSSNVYSFILMYLCFMYIQGLRIGRGTHNWSNVDLHIIWIFIEHLHKYNLLFCIFTPFLFTILGKPDKKTTHTCTHIVWKNDGLVGKVYLVKKWKLRGEKKVSISG